MKKAKIFLGLAIVLILTMACSLTGAGSSTATPQSTTTQSAPQNTQPVPTSTASVDPMELLRSATIQIEAEGSFVDPQYGDVYNATGLGSGFIIDPSGIAVTNNHVVTGSALIKVYVNGETQPRNARILGVSECWDLAVIQIEGDNNNFPYLQFHSGDVNPGLGVYAAGFPLGDPEYTVTKGIVSKAKASGETSWASVDGVIEHDAQILPGNSGGPLVDEEGKVVGINYAANDTYNTNYAIRGLDALPVIDKLKQGQDYESLGINGEAVVSDDGSVSGIWVSSVKSGSPADKVGLEGGDIITRMEGLVLATDGTMSDYCDIIRTRSTSDALSIEVLRSATQEYLTGEINGSALQTKFSFAQDLNSDTQDNGSTYSDYVTVQDDYQSIQVNIPSVWTEVDGSAWQSDDETIGASISAAANLDEFNNYFDEPGVFFGVSNDMAKLGGYVQLLDSYRSTFKDDGCTVEGRTDYDDSVFEGAYDVYSNCGGSNNLMVLLSARPKQNQTDYLVTVLVNIMSDADLNALDEILATFDVVGPLP